MGSGLQPGDRQLRLGSQAGHPAGPGCPRNLRKGKLITFLFFTSYQFARTFRIYHILPVSSKLYIVLTLNDAI